MSKELIDIFINYTKKKLMTICSIAFKELKNDSLTNYCLDKYINTFIDCYYFKKLLTLEKEYVQNFNFAVVNKELEGLKFEILDDLENDEIKITGIFNEDNKKLVQDLKKIVLFAAELVLLNYENCKKKEEFETVISYFLENQKITLETKIKDLLISFMKETILKETKFFESNLNDTFFLDYLKYKDQKDKYFVQLNYKIPKLSRNYRVTSIKKVYNSNKISLKKLNTLTSLLIFDILKKINNKEELKTYFIYIPDSCFEKKEIWLDFLKQWNCEYLRKHLVFLIDLKTYQSNGLLLKKCENDFNFGVLIDLTNIIDIQKKLESLEEISLFSYIVVEKLKDKDYDFIKKYEIVPTKTLIFQDLKQK